MLAELRVRDLGVISDLALVLGPGLTALTGETGAGKTLLVEAIELLVGGRADPVLVRPGAVEAMVDGRFVHGEDEVLLRRVVPSAATGGRSRSYVDGTMAAAWALVEAGRGLVDLHSQHAHQSLLSGTVQRAALDAFAGVDTRPLADARRRVRESEAALAGLGGDARTRAREVDLLEFQVAEITAAGLDDPEEDTALQREADRLGDAEAARQAAVVAQEALTGEGGAADAVGIAVNEGEAMEEDPERMAAIRLRRQALRDLRRKYGDTLADVAAFAGEARDRLDQLHSHDARVAALEAQRSGAVADEVGAAAAVGRARREAAPRLAGAVQAHLRELALPRARLEVAVGATDPGDEVSFLFAANAGEPLLPLTKIASGGELARTMLAARLVLSDAPPTLVFDEVDAGIGGAAAVAVGRALAALAASHQVLVVTHLPQVAAFADRQVAVTKREVGGRTEAAASVLDGAARVVELSRMLSGRPDSTTAHHHAEELLAAAAEQRGR